MPDPSPSLKDIAERVGLSTMTVSRALRGLPKVSEKQRKRILKVAEELGYRPDPKLAQLMVHLRKGRAAGGTCNLAWLTPHEKEDERISNSYRHELYEGARKRAEQQGYALDILSFHQPGLSTDRFRRILEARGIQGVIISPLGSRDRTLEIALEDFAVAAIGYSLESPRFHRVGENFFEDTQLAMARLEEQGCRRIGLAMNIDPKQHMVEHVTGAWAGWCLRAGLPLLSGLIQDGISKKDFQTWLRSEKPDGVLSNIHPGDWMPERVKRCGIGLSLKRSDLQGVHPNLEAIGAGAVDMVAAQILRGDRGVPADRKTMMFSGTWKEIP